MMILVGESFIKRGRESGRTQGRHGRKKKVQIKDKKSCERSVTELKIKKYITGEQWKRYQTVKMNFLLFLFLLSPLVFGTKVVAWVSVILGITGFLF